MTVEQGGTRTFMVLSGPFRNVGDTIIRRRGIQWLQAAGTPHVYVGAGRERWVADVVPDGDVVVHTRFTAWLRALLRTPRRSRALALEPGEFSTDHRFARPVLAAAVLAVVVRLTGGRVLQLPRALAASSPGWGAVYGVAVRVADIALWREERSATRFRRGSLVPDIAFDDPLADPAGSASRSLLTISLRGDREPVDARWFDAVRGAAADLGLQPCVVVQVESDGPRATEIAAELDAELVSWPAQVSSSEQEEALRSVYRRTAITVSDRLHVLVVAAVEGSLVAQVAVRPTTKIERHMLAAGVPCPSFDTGRDSAAVVREGLSSLASQREDVLRRVGIAREKAAWVRRASTTTLRGRPTFGIAERPVTGSLVEEPTT
ncbi:hypothetical protein [Cellulosimicrobium arenosum]|uniref:Polysaccharide pyruvyl transferase domain-containing protein n=1 Tax=Cellulosimicrobium arenosum TaxID=2708133 RepID=A0A927J0X5_9MICO|nr:hypothetical protein [Cellulosimicrobium arenosum]MBD8079767.1 hypothetical protein [Cellulosimicrobium arenosum]